MGGLICWEVGHGEVFEHAGGGAVPRSWEAKAPARRARLKISRALPEAAQLVEELQNFKIKVTLAGNDTYEAWRESDHDDLVLAAAMAAWYGEKKLHSILHLPPMPRPPIETKPPTLDELIKLQPKSGGDGRRERI